MNPRDRPTRLAVDVGLGVLSVALLVVTAVAIAESWGGGYWVFGCVGGAVVCVLALACRHRPWAAAAGLVVAVVAIAVARAAHLPAEPGPAMTLGLSVLLGAAIRTLPVRWAIRIAVGGLAVVVGAWVTAPTFPILTVTPLNALGWLAAVGTGTGLRLLAVRRRAMAERVRRDERLELARELHDVVAHHLTGVVLHAQAARIVREPEQLDDSLTGIETAGTEALAAMRRVVGLLRDTDDTVTVTSGPEQLGDLVSRFPGPPVRLRGPDGDPGWPPEVTSTVYRVVQESLTNISRHAQHAHSVTVDVTEDRDTITVEVIDDVPPAHHRRDGYGLVGMRERVEALGGTLSAGWAVRATVPVREPR